MFRDKLDDYESRVDAARQVVATGPASDEDGLAFAVRIVMTTTVPPRDEKRRGTLSVTSFDVGFDQAKRTILKRLLDEQERRFRRRVEK